MSDEKAFEQKNDTAEDETFKVMVKRIEVPGDWYPNFLREQMTKPWQEAGTVRWKFYRFETDIGDIESI